jgi:hypothetical protein
MVSGGAAMDDRPYGWEVEAGQSELNPGFDIDMPLLLPELRERQVSDPTRPLASLAQAEEQIPVDKVAHRLLDSVFGDN